MDLIEVREKLFNSVKEELLGPGSEQTGVNIEEEIITDKPSNRYVTGILFTKEDNQTINNNNENEME